jgi:hypothetical protein
MTWLYRAMELDDGWWACRHGLQLFDAHPQLDDAIAHCSELAGNNRPSRVLLHPLGGTAVEVAVFS